MLNFASAEDPAALANAFHELQDGQFDWIVLTSATTVDVLVSQGTRIPDGTRVAEVELWPTGHVFRARNRGRVLLAGGSHPRFARNTGTGDRPYWAMVLSNTPSRFSFRT